MKKGFAALGLLVVLGWSAVFAQAARPAVSAKVTFRRIFQGSTPEFIELTVRDDSKTATYEIRQMDEDPGAVPFEVGDALRNRIFALTAELHNFQGQDLD